MTKEEYKENLIRMWDSLRIMSNAYEAIDLVENWAKENQVKTNAEKFKEVFGVEYDPINSCIKHNVKCGNCLYYNYDGTCDVNRFWNAEYNGGE